MHTARINARAALITLLGLLSGCATIVNGSTQPVAVSTNPPGANCDVSRMGSHIGSVPLTPGSVTIDKSKNDLSVTCTKDGFVTANTLQPASFGGATFGNILLGGFIGAAVDAASGANYTYHDVNMALSPDPAFMLATPPVAQFIPNPAYRPIPAMAVAYPVH
jgi:hypothetical protein